MSHEHSLQVTVAIDVDTSELRSPSKSPGKSLSIKQKLEHWKPARAELDLEGKMERAAKRRHKVLVARSASLAQRNQSVAKTAEERKTQTKTLTQLTQEALQASLLSADQKRTAAVEGRSEAAKLHLAHAKQIADSQRAMKELLLNEKRQSIERRLAMAAAKQQLKKDKAAYKAAVAAARSAQLATQLATQLDAKVDEHQTKLEAAQSRRDDVQQARLNKLCELSDHAKQVRRNKGSTASPATVSAEKILAATNESMAFEVDIKSSPSSPKKSPVQLRLEQRAAAESALDKLAPNGANGEAVRRRLTMMDEKKKMLSTKHEHVSAVIKRKLDDELLSVQSRQTKLTSRLAAAEDRRGARLNAMAKKNASQLERAVEIRADQNLAIEQAKLKADQALLLASERNSAEILKRKAKGTAYASPWSPARNGASVAAC